MLKLRKTQSSSVPRSVLYEAILPNPKHLVTQSLLMLTAGQQEAVAKLARGVQERKAEESSKEVSLAHYSVHHSLGYSAE